MDIAAMTPIAKPVSKLPPGAKAVMPGASTIAPPVWSEMDGDGETETEGRHRDKDRDR